VNIYVVDDDPGVRVTLQALLEEMGHDVQSFSRAQAFLSVATELTAGCAILDLCLPDMDGLALQSKLAEQESPHAVIVVTGFGDVPEAVTAMRSGALDFLRKPFRSHEIFQAVTRAQNQLTARHAEHRAAQHTNAFFELSRRELDVLGASAKGAPSKEVAFALGLSVRTVEMHRANIIRKLHVPNFGAALLLAQRGGLLN
jgi:two-component system response regulator FixJ